MTTLVITKDAYSFIDWRLKNEKIPAGSVKYITCSEDMEGYARCEFTVVFYHRYWEHQNWEQIKEALFRSLI